MKYICIIMLTMLSGVTSISADTHKFGYAPKVRLIRLVPFPQLYSLIKSNEIF